MRICICLTYLPHFEVPYQPSAHAKRHMQVSLNEVQNDLVYSAAAYAILGRPGVVLINCIIFMAVTSSGSGEMLAVSSLFTFDFYREYLRPRVRSAAPPADRYALLSIMTRCYQE